MHPKELRIQDFTYDLPDERIARYPLPERDTSKLLIYEDGKITDDTYRNIATHIPAGTLMVFNQAKVVHARLFFTKETGGVIEVFCLAPHKQYPDIQTAMLQREEVLWECLIGGASKWKNGLVLESKHETPSFTLTTEVAEKGNGAYILRLAWDKPSFTFADVLHHAGEVPLPPYLHRNAEDKDKDTYQTVYAKVEGSVAAPTAGLHFTDTVLKQLTDKGVEQGFATLHVGAGTFIPVKSDTMDGHNMHAEWIEVTQELLLQLIHAGDRNIVAVGTTSIRTIESLYWMGNLMLNGGIPDFDSIAVTQWQPYEPHKHHEPEKALTALLGYMRLHEKERLITRTEILIAPGYSFKVANGLVTNFHQPQSTLLLLVAAMIGSDWIDVYYHALKNDYRFLSYGDGSLLWL